MTETKIDTTKKPYTKPELKIVKVRPREVLGTSCHNSVNTARDPDCAGFQCVL